MHGRAAHRPARPDVDARRRSRPRSWPRCPVQSFQDVVNLQAGVVEGHFRGGRTGEVAYLVDGVPVNDVYDQSFAFQIENQAIQEVQVISGHVQRRVRPGAVRRRQHRHARRRRALRGQRSAPTAATTARRARTSSSARARSRRSANAEVNGSFSGPVPGLGSRLTFFASGPRGPQRGLPLRPPGRHADVRDHERPRPGRASTGGRSTCPAWATARSRASTAREQQTRAAQAHGPRALRPALAQRPAPARPGPQLRPPLPLQPGGPDDRLRPLGVAHRRPTRPSSRATTFVDVKARRRSPTASTSTSTPTRSTRATRSDSALRELSPQLQLLPRRRPQHVLHPRHADDASAASTSRARSRGGTSSRAGSSSSATRSTSTRSTSSTTPATGFVPAIPEAGTPAHVQYDAAPGRGARRTSRTSSSSTTSSSTSACGRTTSTPARRVPSDFTLPTTGERVADERQGPVLAARSAWRTRSATRAWSTSPTGTSSSCRPSTTCSRTRTTSTTPTEGRERPFGYADLEPQQTVAYEIGLQQALSRPTSGST